MTPASLAVAATGMRLSTTVRTPTTTVYGDNMGKDEDDEEDNMDSDNDESYDEEDSSGDSNHNGDKHSTDTLQRSSDEK